MTLGALALFVKLTGVRFGRHKPVVDPVVFSSFVGNNGLDVFLYSKRNAGTMRVVEMQIPYPVERLIEYCTALLEALLALVSEISGKRKPVGSRESIESGGNVLLNLVRGYNL